MESTTDHGRSDFDRQDLLDDFFDRAVGALQMGKPVPFPDEIRADASLTAAAERLVRVARALCGSAAPTIDVHGYTILSELGRGGMGVVYLARQERLGGRPVAIKILPSHVTGSLSARARFKAEIMSVAKQRHAGIVSVFDIVEDGETLAYIMEWVDGLTVQQVIDLWTDHPGPNDGSHAIAITPDQRMSILHERLDAKRPDESFFDFAARIGESVARALAAVHASGVIHRDIKPSNILIRRDGTPLLSDFGLAKDTSRDTLTVGAGFIGTLGYASPEQLRGEDLDFRTDIFSLGATLYHLLLLVPPTTASGVPAALRSLQDRNHIRALRESSPTHTGLVAIIERAMAFDRNDRFGSAQEMADAFAAGEVIPTTASTGRRAKWISGVRWAAVPAVILAVASAGVALRSCSGRADADIWQNPTRLTLLNPTSGDEFGHAVSGHGDRLLVSAFRGDIADGGEDGIDAGRAAVFVYQSGGWRQEAELSASDLCRGSKFGKSVLLMNDTAIVGTPGATVDGVPFAGAVYVFGRIDGEWKQTQRITAPVPFERDEFGFRMAASGDIVVVTSFFRSPVAAKEGPRAMPVGTGPAHVFRLQNQRLTHLQTIAPEALRSPDTAGLAPEVMEGGEYMVLAGPFANTIAGEQTGAVYVYSRQPNTDEWKPLQELTVPSPRPYDNFGFQVVAFRPKDAPGGIGGVHLAISAATWAFPEASRVGKVFVFRPEFKVAASKDEAKDPSWVLDSEIAPEVENRIQHALFGHSILEFDGHLAIFRKSRGTREFRCQVDIYAPTRTNWLRRHTVQLGNQDEDDLGLSMDSWVSGTERHIVFSAPALDWPEPADIHQNRGAVWAWRVPAR